MKKNINSFIKNIIVRVAHTTPRSKRKWLFGMDSEFYDNSKYAFLYLNIYHKEINTIWITKSKVTRDYIRSLGYKSYLRWEVLGIWHGLTAGIYLFSYSLYDVHFLLKGNSTSVNLWHGLPLKAIHFNSRKQLKTLQLDRLDKKKYKFEYLLSPSSKMHQVFENSFLINKNQIIEALYPRCEYLINVNFKQQVEVHDSIKTIIKNIEKYRKVYIYLPTWRDSGSDFFKVKDFDLEVLNNILVSNNEIFLVKLHAATKQQYILMFDGYSNIFCIDNSIKDIYPLLLFSDVLITDYSSIYFDYLLLEKPIILFPFDIEDYESQSRELAFDYDDMMVGSRVNSFQELLTTIEDKSYEKYLPLLIEHKNKIWCDNSFETLIETISQKYSR